MVRANTNRMREQFESAATALIEVDPFKRSSKAGGNPREANISSLDSSAGRGKPGVDLRCHPTKDFKALSDEQQAELKTFMKSSDGKKLMKKSPAAAT